MILILLYLVSADHTPFCFAVPPTLGPLPLEYVFIEGDVNRTLDCFGRTDQREFIADPEPTVHWLRDGCVLPFPREHVRH